jgi:hypothetical protein
MIVGKATDEEEPILKTTLIDEDERSAIRAELLERLLFPLLEDDVLDDEDFFEELESIEESSSRATELA